MDRFLDFIYAIPWYAWIAIIGIICSTIVSTNRLRFRHAERMAMIDKGLDPGKRQH